MPKIELLHEEMTGRIIGTFYQVHAELGSGFLESAYQRAMAIALTDEGIGCRREVPISIYFRGQPIGDHRIDLIVDERVIVECKTADRIVPAHLAQLLNYLKATGRPVGLLLNFGLAPTFKRLVNERPRPTP